MKKQLGFALLMLSLAVPSSFASENFEVTVGNSRVIGPVQEMATVIIGDDGVAGATLGGGGTIILTGKMLGATNIIVLDEGGRELLSSDLNVVPLDNRARTTVRVSRGTSEAQNYVCGPTPGCSPVGNAEAAMSLAGTFGPCMRPGDVAADGSQCGGRAASARPGGVDGEGQPE